MKKLWLVLCLFASVAVAQEKFSLEQKASPKPTGQQGDIPWASSTTAIGWIPHASGTKCLQQIGNAQPTWVACGGGSPLTTKGDIWVYSTVDDRLPIGTNGYVLEPDSTTATGLKWVDPDVAGTGWVKLQTSFPGSIQTGSHNVTGKVGFGPFLATTATSGSDTYGQLFHSAAAVGSIYSFLMGGNTTASQYDIWTRAPSGGAGESEIMGISRHDKNYAEGLIYMQSGSATNGTLCLATDPTLYPAGCAGFRSRGPRRFPSATPACESATPASSRTTQVAAWV